MFRRPLRGGDAAIPASIDGNLVSRCHGGAINERYCGRQLLGGGGLTGPGAPLGYHISRFTGAGSEIINHHSTFAAGGMPVLPNQFVAKSISP